MEQRIILGITLTIIGGALIVFSDKFTSVNIATQKQFFRIQLTDKEIVATKRAAFLFGLIVAVIGILTMFDIASWKG